MMVAPGREETKYKNKLDILLWVLTSINDVSVCVSAARVCVYSEQCLRDLTGIINDIVAVCDGMCEE